MGFDKTVQFENGDYTEEVTLPKGTLLCRYGLAIGRFTALAGTPYENLALPYKPETIPYMQYRVVADGLKVKLNVIKGVVAPMFASKGGVIHEYYGAAGPPVRRRRSHDSGRSEPAVLCRERLFT